MIIIPIIFSYQPICRRGAPTTADSRQFSARSLPAQNARGSRFLSRLVDLGFAHEKRDKNVTQHGCVTENVVYYPKPNGFADHYPVLKLLFHWGYTPFSDIPTWHWSIDVMFIGFSLGFHWFSTSPCDSVTRKGDKPRTLFATQGPLRDWNELKHIETSCIILFCHGHLEWICLSISDSLSLSSQSSHNTRFHDFGIASSAPSPSKSE